MNKRTILFLLLVGVMVLNQFSGAIIKSQNRTHANSWYRLLSSWYWIQGYHAWLEKDASRLIDRYSFAAAFEPTNLFYWRLAAQTIAYDLPVWDIEAKEGHSGRLSDSDVELIRVSFGQQALSFFERSRELFENDGDWYLTGAFLAEAVCLDKERAIKYLEKAITLPEIPFAAGRSYARILVEKGEIEKAHAFLVSWLPSLQNNLFEARISEISNWIRELETALTSSIPD
jgi:tetratricopeptide (TPR) repeat protein